MTQTSGRILVVDDDPNLLRVVSMRLQKEGYAVTSVDSAEKALAQVAISAPDLVLTDLKMGGMDGMALFEALARQLPGLPVIIMTAHGTVPDAVTATRRGVFGFLPKPFESQQLLTEIERALRLTAARDRDEAREVITRDPAMEAILNEARQVAATDASVLVLGQSGTGKEMLARWIHRHGKRSGGPFVAVNCGAIPEQLLESELFGHVKGAFTGAVRDRRGLFQEAQGGTLFLDEIAEMPTPLQVKLLRAVQERQVRPVGADRDLPVDVRIVSATNLDIDAQIQAGRFREDLYYRLNVVSFKLPPLSERRQDIPHLANHFLRLHAKRYGKDVRAFAPECLEMLMTARWPGNVRQLSNVVERLVALAGESLIPATAAERAITREEETLSALDDAKREFEREYLIRLLKQTRGNVTRAAKLAQRNRSEFYSLLHRHQLDPGLFKAT
jgi:two-component system, NtrC family, response regulator GlrR